VLESGLNEKPLWPALITIVLAAAVAARTARRERDESIVVMNDCAGES
jgi:hypothetical protein